MATNTGSYCYNTTLKRVVKYSNKIPNINNGVYEEAYNKTLGIDKILNEPRLLPPYISGYDYNGDTIHSKERFI